MDNPDGQQGSLALLLSAPIREQTLVSIGREITWSVLCNVIGRRSSQCRAEVNTGPSRIQNQYTMKSCMREIRRKKSCHIKLSNKSYFKTCLFSLGDSSPTRATLKLVFFFGWSSTTLVVHRGNTFLGLFHFHPKCCKKRKICVVITVRSGLWSCQTSDVGYQNSINTIQFPIFINYEAKQSREIMQLVASVHLCVCGSVCLQSAGICG